MDKIQRILEAQKKNTFQTLEQLKEQQKNTDQNLEIDTEIQLLEVLDEFEAVYKAFIKGMFSFILVFSNYANISLNTLVHKYPPPSSIQKERQV